MNVCRLNMSHGSHDSHRVVVDLVREYNASGRGVVATMLDTKVGGVGGRGGGGGGQGGGGRGTMRGAAGAEGKRRSRGAGAGGPEGGVEGLRRAPHPHPPHAQGPEVRSGDLAEPIDMAVGQRYTFTIEEGANGKGGRISVNYDDFIRGGVGWGVGWGVGGGGEWGGVGRWGWG
jgi:hypothetical protein